MAALPVSRWKPRGSAACSYCLVIGGIALLLRDLLPIYCNFDLLYLNLELQFLALTLSATSVCPEWLHINYS